MAKMFTFSQYAEHRRRAGMPGATRQAVSQAVSRGRLARSVVRVDGVPRIADLAAADLEWLSNTSYAKSPHLSYSAAGAIAQPRGRAAWGDDVPADAVFTVDEALL